MQASVTYNKDKAVPVITLSSETEGEELSLQLLADSNKFTIVLELSDAEELVIKKMLGKRKT